MKEKGAGVGHGVTNNDYIRDVRTGRLVAAVWSVGLVLRGNELPNWAGMLNGNKE